MHGEEDILGAVSDPQPDCRFRVPAHVVLAPYDSNPVPELVDSLPFELV